MPDRKNVVTGLKCCITHPNEYGDCMSEDCPYKSINCVDHLLQDALVLLQAQESVEPKLVGVNTWTCGECGALIGWEDFTQSGLELVNYKYCPVCGKAVKWND